MTVDAAEDLHIPTYQDVLAAHERVKPWIHRTPILTSRFLNELAGAELFFKCENLQKAGAFKVRGACNAVFGLSDAKAAKGVATHSSGNHALSLELRRRPPRHPLPRRDAAHRAAGEEGRGPRLRRRHHRVRALDLLARGGLRPRPGRDRRRLRASLQRRAGDRRAGDLLEGDHRGSRRARRRRRADRRRRHDLRHLPDAVEHRAPDQDLRRRARGGRRRLPVVQAGPDRRLRRAGNRRRRPEGAAEGAHLALRLALRHRRADRVRAGDRRRDAPDLGAA